jgi:hypothetical protein
MGRPGTPFAEFRFNDQLVWLVVITAAAFVLPLPPEAEGLLGNIAIVASGLYAARGLAVTWGSLGSFPFLVLVVMLLGLLFILPVALGGFFALGLADTWVDFRRRFPAGADSRRE